MEHSLSQKKFGLSGYDLKMIGILLMVLDHIHQMFETQGAPLFLQMLGRLAMPLFLFLLAEGYHYTHSKKDYLLRLLIAGWIMGILNILIQRVFPSETPLMNDIFMTMAISFIYFWAWDQLKDGIKEKQGKKIALGVLTFLAPFALFFLLLFVIMPAMPTIGAYLLIFIPNPITVEGSMWAVGLALLFHIFRPVGRIPQLLGLAAMSLLMLVTGDWVQSLMIFAAIPLFFYNGKQGRRSKWFFYIFYPTHIYFLYILAYFL